MATIPSQHWVLPNAYVAAQSLQSAALDDVVAMAVLAVLSAVYLLRGTLWDRPDPHLYKMYERPQEKMGSTSVNTVSRDVSERMQQMVSNLSVIGLPERRLTIVTRTQILLSSGVPNQARQSALRVDSQKRSSNVTERRYSSLTCRIMNLTLSPASRTRSWPSSSCRPLARATPAIMYMNFGAGSSQSVASH